MNLEFWANVATILSLPISIIAVFIGGQAIYKVNKTINNSQNNEMNNNESVNNNQNNKIENSQINQTITRS